MIIILFGPPGSGKGTQAQNLEAQENFLHISTGNLLREAVAQKSELGKSVKSILASGQLVGNDIVASLLRGALQSSRASHVVLDGFPRTLEQVTLLDEILSSLGKSIDLVISLEVDSRLLIERMTGRFSCKDCGTGYHRIYKKTALPDICDACGSDQFMVREDDNIAVVSKRIDVYLQETFPILSVYRQRDLVKTLDGAQNPQQVFKQICDSFKSIVKEAI